MTEIASLPRRLWIYQRERFPLAKVIPLLAAFSAAGLSIAAIDGDKAGFPWGAFSLGLALATLIFFQLRVCDEVKDLEDDRTYRPERPIPRGLIRLNTLVGLGLITALFTIALVVWWNLELLWLLALVWLWLAAMTYEFAVPEWLKARAALYLLSHMLIMPLIALLITGLIWLEHGSPSAALLVFLALTFVNGCLLEIGRKLLAPEQERRGVDSYSKLWGSNVGGAVWLSGVLSALVLQIILGAMTETLLITMAYAVPGAAVCTYVGWSYRSAPNKMTAGWIEGLSGFWVLLTYAGLALTLTLAVNKAA